MRNQLNHLTESPAKFFAIWVMLLLVFISASFTRAQGQAPTSVPDDAVEETAGDIVQFTTQTAQATANTLEDFINRLIQTPRSDVARVLLIIGGVLLLVAGWRIYDFVTLVAGFLIGALIALSLVVTDNTLITIAAILLGGLIGAALGYFLYYIAVFLIGAYIGVVVTGGLAFQFSLGPVNPVVLLIGALIGGLVLIGLSFQFLILLSALVGAQMLTLGLNLTPIWTLILAAVGVIVQLVLARAYNFDWRRAPRRVYLWRRSTV